MLDTYVLFQYSMPSSERASIVHTIPASPHRRIANALKGYKNSNLLSPGQQQAFKSPHF
jgi:hypothetical protein